MDVLFIADPPEKLLPASDSTLCLVEECLRRAWGVFWTTHDRVEFVKGDVRVQSRRVDRLVSGKVPELTTEDSGRSITDFATIWIRKDPPFDSNYVRLCWILSLVEGRAKILNRPAHLLRYHEKLIPFEALSQGFLHESDVVPTCIGSSKTAWEFIQENSIEDVVSKPFLGFGGNQVRLEKAVAWHQRVSREDHGDVLVQPFLPAVHVRGDCRVFFVEGKRVGHVHRMPAPGTFISNLAQGGRAELLPLTKEEEGALDRLGKFLKVSGIFLAGADLLGGKISEVNITSPTGLRAIERLAKKDIAKEIIDAAIST